MSHSVNKSKKNIEFMFDEIAPTYDKLNHLFTLNLDMKWRREIVKSFFNHKSETRIILDIASGTGDLTKELLRLDPQKIYSADISKKMLEVQSKKISDKRLVLVHTDGLKLPFANDMFDLVTIGFGVRNFENLKLSMLQIHKVMKKNSRLVILEMFKSDNFKTKIFNLYFGKLMPLIGNKISGSRNAYSYLYNSVNTFYTVDDFIRICYECGFKLQMKKNNFLGIVNTVYLVKN
ncbi:MAG: ubiquinone/menaquinone biosynthesis methyltransferase [Ignavibacteria bacterium]